MWNICVITLHIVWVLVPNCSFWLIFILTFISNVVQPSTYKKINLDTILKKILKRQLPFLIGGTITGVIMTYYYGFLFSIIVNSAIWMLVSFIVNKYYYKSTGFKDEKYLLQYGLAKINTRTKRTAE
jgi:uncharacterized membrane protein AbrB (regulator of aidB expression)